MTIVEFLTAPLIVSLQVAEYLEALGGMRDRDFLVIEPLPRPVVTPRIAECASLAGRQLLTVRKDRRYKR